MDNEDVEFLVDLQKRMNEQDETPAKCGFQASPYFWGVAENKIEWGVECDYSDDLICLIYDCSQYNTIQECKDFFLDRLDLDIADDDEDVEEINNISDWEDVEDYVREHDIDGYIVYGRKNKDVISVYTGCFLTKQACKDHIEKYGYNYSEPHTFAMTASRNPEFERVWNILKKTDWKQNEQLKAENERLKEETYYYAYERQKHTNSELFRENQKLNQQLKEKDEEIARLIKGEYQKCCQTCDAFQHQKDLTEEAIKDNTKQVCEKIRKGSTSITKLIDGTILYYTISKRDLDQIENGGVK